MNGNVVESKRFANFSSYLTYAMNTLLLSLAGLPVALTGLAGHAPAHMRGPGPGFQPPNVTVVAIDQVPAQKTIVQQALDKAKAALEQLTANVKTLQTDQKALAQALAEKNETLVASLKTKVEQDRATVKTSRDTHHEAMRAFMAELFKLPEADRAAFRDQLKPLHEDRKELHQERREFRQGMKPRRGDHREMLRGKWQERLNELHPRP